MERRNPSTWTASDGVELAWHELGEGRPVILLHGLFSDAEMNWIKFGHAERIAARGFRVIMPDLRAHGLSGKPHEPAAYPQRHPGPRPRGADRASRPRPNSTSAAFRSARGRRSRRSARAEAAPRDPCRHGARGADRLGAAQGISSIEAIDQFDSVERGDPHWLAIQFMKTMKVDRVAARLLLADLRGRAGRMAGRGLHHADPGGVRHRGR